jgi:hypothetical protein
MRNLSTSLFVLFTVFVFAINAHARTPSSAVQASVAELGFRIGPETNTIAGGRIDDRTFVDKRHIIVPGSDSRSYLVRFRQSCQGALSKQMVHRQSKIQGNVSQYDKFVTRYEGRSLAHCEIRWIWELEPI